MFKLRRLEITGFKSFADHTDLIFTGDGITGVVGPNGCGKSNVADAIAWVLGEQRIKHLRGAEMKDVIFQGSSNRKPSGMAEVVLHLERDEVVEQEPDIEDIDSTLEQIDEHAAVFTEAEPLTEAVGANTLPDTTTIETSIDSTSGGIDPAAGLAPPYDARLETKPRKPTHPLPSRQRTLRSCVATCASRSTSARPPPSC